MRLWRVIGVVSGLVVLPLACSANTDGLFSGDGDDDGSGGTSVGGATNTTNTSTQTDGGSGPGPAPASVGVGGMGPAQQSSVVASSSTGTDVKVEIPCGVQTCVGSDICCVSDFAASQDHCAQPGQCGNNFIEVACNGPMDCPGVEICCGRYSQQVGYLEVNCSPTCDSSGPGVPIVMCGDDPSTCEPNQGCYPSGSLPVGHSFCQ